MRMPALALNAFARAIMKSIVKAPPLAILKAGSVPSTIRPLAAARAL